MRDTRGKHVTEIFGEQHQRIAALEAALRGLVGDAWFASGGTVTNAYVVSEGMIESAREVLAAASVPTPNPDAK